VVRYDSRSVMCGEGLWYWGALSSSYWLVEDGRFDAYGLLGVSYSIRVLLVLVEVMFGIGWGMLCCW